MKTFSCLLILFAMLSPASSWGDLGQFPTADLDSRTARIQAKVEALYQRGAYKRAHFIYANELARIGDKYAQYMIGYMYQMGQGVEEDKVMASAWYRIAAERKVREFLVVRDRLMQTLDDDQRARSDELYLELRREYSDIVIAMGLLEDDLDSLRETRTGSRLPGSGRAVMIVDPTTGSLVSADHLQKRVLRAVQARLDFVTERLDIDSIRADQARRHLDALRERVESFLSVVDDEAEGLYASP